LKSSVTGSVGPAPAARPAGQSGAGVGASDVVVRVARVSALVRMSS
jgi:hypothetical protein